MAATYTIKLDTKKLDKILQEMPDRANDILDLAARRIETRAKANVPVDTGALKGSINVFPPKPMAREIGDGVEYGIYVEKGSRGKAARPWLGNAVEGERPAFLKAWGQLLE